MVPPASSQYWLQYFLPSGTEQRQAGWAHFPSFLSDINPPQGLSSNRKTRRPAQGFEERIDKSLVTDLLRNAERIFETAASAEGAELESGTLAILIGQDGAIRMVMDTDWSLESLQAHHGASAAYKVTRTAAQVRVEGKSRTNSCVLESEPPAAVAKRMLMDRPRYLLAA
jgi:hypothetical protein